jgi:hypothetical protein
VFYYPLYALGDEQLHRVADAAVLQRYEQLGGPRRANGRWPTLKSRLDWLIARAFISREVEQRWDAIRSLRNYGSHATFQSLRMPMDALRTLEILRDEIDALFESPDATRADKPDDAPIRARRTRAGRTIVPAVTSPRDAVSVVTVRVRGAGDLVRGKSGTRRRVHLRHR